MIDISPYYIDVEGADNAAFSSSLTVRIHVLDVEIDPEDEGDVRTGWNGELGNPYDQRLVIFVRSDIYTYSLGSSVQDTGHWRKANRVLHSRYLRIIDSNLERQLDFFKDLTGFDADVDDDPDFLDKYGFADIYPINVARKSVSRKTDDTAKFRQMEITLHRTTLGM